MCRVLIYRLQRAKNHQKEVTNLRSIGFLGGSESNRSSEVPMQVAKMTLMDKREFRDMNGLATIRRAYHQILFWDL